MKRGNLKGPKKVQYGLSENAISWGFKKSFPLFLMDNIKLEEIPSKIKRTIILLTALYRISNFAGTSYKKSHDTATGPFISWCFTSADNFIHHYQKNDFWHFLMDSTQPLVNGNSQNP